MSNTDESVSEQTKIAPFMEMNRYDRLADDIPSKEVYEPPRRTLGNGWKKFHATHECGSERVRYVENTRRNPVSEKYEYDLRCGACGYRIEEDDVLFIGGEWYMSNGWKSFGRPLEDLRLPEERVVELGPDPDEGDLLHALNITRIEGESSRGFTGFSFGNRRWFECDECEKQALPVFDDKCRMCYDGEWTESMQKSVDTLGRLVKESNRSFKHRLTLKVDPFSINDRAYEGKVLWRRREHETLPKLVEVTQCLKDDDDGHWEYVLEDLPRTNEWLHHEDDVENLFWDTELRNEADDPLSDERLRELHERVC